MIDVGVGAVGEVDDVEEGGPDEVLDSCFLLCRIAGWLAVCICFV